MSVNYFTLAVENPGKLVRDVCDKNKMGVVIVMARICKCETCFGEYRVGRCCSIKSACGGEEFQTLLQDIKAGAAPGSNWSTMREGPYVGQVDPCARCDDNVQNDAASNPTCPGVQFGASPDKL
jgi:hypothetical protein